MIPTTGWTKRQLSSWVAHWRPPLVRSGLAYNGWAVGWERTGEAWLLAQLLPCWPVLLRCYCANSVASALQLPDSHGIVLSQCSDIYVVVLWMVLLEGCMRAIGVLFHLAWFC
jgi:hypothetical protein